MSKPRLFMVTFVVSLAQLTVGMFLGWTSPMIPKLLAEDSSFRITEAEASWTVSLLKLGMAFGCFLSIFIVDFAGRKIAILLAIIPTVSSWLLIVWGRSILNLYLARVIGGTASGIIFTAGSMYVTEISPPHVRGALGSCFVLMDYCGSLLGYVLGSFTSMEEYSYVAISLSMLQFLIFIWFPETPYFLLRRKHYGDAMDSLIFLRGSPVIVEEMDSIMKSVECEPKNSGVFSSILHLITQPGGKKEILIGACIMTMQAFSGSIIVIGYAQTLFEYIHDADVELSGSYMSIVLATVHLISYLLCIGQVDRLGRRPLMIASVIGVATCSFFLGIYFCMQEHYVDVNSLQWVAFVAVLFYAASISLGLASVPFVVMNEIFPMYAKATCVSLCFCLNSLWSFAMVCVWSLVAFQHSLYAAFWLVTGLNAFGILFLIFYLPETKRMTLSLIQEKIGSFAKK
ncbi:solute carrier family 2, facilitated glucose transporter member 8-like isoform X1 [Hylaeus volcanicus]|uniref:solute carrier family 2, facilitated glucose transporter member 8-like isoform X1 n=2 Tax=Hylaeus volcanicus TaxID=313075 RepID=UPI0023B79A32|nr:solute carrier family 2, facilitated glucose transporter member 8-like isoform X1 [Hylaeus volcanicus]